MAYNILAINPGHNGSAALVSDGEVKYYIEEERLSRMKYDGNPFRGMIDIMQRWPIDELVIAGTGQEDHKLPWTGEDAYTALVRKFYPQVKVSRIGHEHHLGHAACAFYNSGYDKAIAIIVDGAGSKHKRKIDAEDENSPEVEGYEVESVFVCEYPVAINPVFKSYGFNTGGKHELGPYIFDDAVSLTKSYEAVSQYLGFGFIEAGKTMGLASYGKQDKNIPPLFYNGRGSKDIFIPSYPAGALIDQARNPQFKQEDDPKAWHDDPSKLPEIAKNLAWHIQQETQNQILGLIRYAVDHLNIKNVVIAGGYGLNCVANYHFKKSLPADVNLYCEPIAHDGGTAIGAAKLFWHLGSKSSEIKPQTSLYYGPEYSTDEVKYAIDAHVKQDLIEFETVSYDDVAKLISEENIVSMYQGRSEAGPRALGNRSILFDPRVHDGKDIVNTVKGREWFRPFAATVIKESANDWFDMAGLEESPFMMYAVNVAADKIKKIPSVCHVDDTCRVQTVTEEQNQHYYNLISAFDKITNVPILFNTSFNLAGDPLVETIHDALGTLYRSKLKYMYLPELGVLITKKLADPEPRKEEPVAEQSTDNESVEENTDDNVTAED
jgi:carbamoyltransferase